MPIVLFPASLLSAISCLIIPEFSRFNVRKEYNKIKKYSKKLILYSVAFSSMLTFIFLIFGNALGKIIYKDITVGLYIKIFAPLIPFMYIDIMVDSILKGLDAQVNVLFINIIDLLISICFIIFFVPMYGINGFIASIFISEIINFSLSLKKLLNILKSLS